MNRRNIIIGVILLIVIFVVMNNLKSEKKDMPISSDSTSVQAKELYKAASELKGSKKIVEAKQTYEKILAEFPDTENVESIQKELEDLNMQIIFSNVNSPDAVIHEVQPGDTLGKLAKKHGTTVELIKKSNRLNSDVIRVGQRIRIWNKKFNIFVDKSQNILILKDGEEVVKVYNVATGEHNSTPVGDFTITSRLTDPVWFNRGVVVPPESPQNVLGSRWLGFDIPGYGIHGTIEPETIGQQITAGCVRMRNSEVEELYSMIPLGTKVVVTD